MAAIPFIVLCILALVVWLLVWSVVSLAKIGGLRSELNGQAAALAAMREELRRLRGAAPAPAPVAAPPPPLTAPAAVRPLAMPPPVVAPAAAALRPAESPAAAAPAPVDRLPPVPAAGAREPSAPPHLPPAAEPPQALPAFNWEIFMGVKLFAWLGGLALFLGVALFVKYSFDNNLIPPAVRMALGFLAGTALLAGGVALARRPYRVTAHTLCATGVVILYAVTFACRSIYHFSFFGPLPTFLLMALITATAFVVAVRLEAPVVALLGMLGGFLTPVLLSTGVDNPLGLFGYIALLDLGLLAVALHRRWFYLGTLAALGTVAMEIGWVAKFFVAVKVYTALNVFVGFDLLFLLAVAAERRWSGEPAAEADRGWLAGAAAGLAFVSLGFAFYLLAYPVIADRQPWLLFAFVFGADGCLLALAVLAERWAKLHLAAGGVVFVLLASWLADLPDLAGGQPLHWALAASLVFAGLHTCFPLVLQRVRPAAAPAWWAHLFPPATLLLALLVVARGPDVTFLVWPTVLLVDLLAIGVALATGGLVAIGVALVLTLSAAGCWILRVPADLAPVPTLLALTGGFGVLFTAACTWGLRRLASPEPRPGQADTPAWLAAPAGAEHLPAFSAALPFLLLVMIVLRIPLANPSPVFGLALLLVVLLLGLARLLAHVALPAVALGCTALLEWVWLDRRLVPGGAATVLAWNLGFYAIFAAFPFVFRRCFARRLAPWVASAAAGPVHFYLIYQLVRATWPNDVMGLIPALFAVPALAGLGLALRALPADAPRRLDVLAWFGGVALLFVTLIFPIQFERQWITVGWALEGAALLWLYLRVPHAGLRLAGAGLLVAAFARLAVNPAVLAYHPRAATAVFNWYLYAYGLTTLCLIAGARLLASPRAAGRPGATGIRGPVLLYSLAGVLAFLLLNIEIADYYSPPGQALTFEFSGNFARDMTYTIAWALFAFGLLVIGIARRVRATRYAAIGLLSVALLKLLLRDLANLGGLYRIGAFMVVAVVAILASFLYQRFLPPEEKP